MRNLRKPVQAGGVIGASAACRGGEHARGAVSALAKDEATMRLDWTLQGFHLPFVWALDKGYYDAEAIDANRRRARLRQYCRAIGARPTCSGGGRVDCGADPQPRRSDQVLVASFSGRRGGRLLWLRAHQDAEGSHRQDGRDLARLVLYRALPCHAQGLEYPGFPDEFVTVDNRQSREPAVHRADAITGLMSAECAQVQAESGRAGGQLHAGRRFGRQGAGRGADRQ